jgi:hypothetical protein
MCLSGNKETFLELQFLRQYSTILPQNSTAVKGLKFNATVQHYAHIYIYGQLFDQLSCGFFWVLMTNFLEFCYFVIEILLKVK